MDSELFLSVAIEVGAILTGFYATFLPGLPDSEGSRILSRR